MLYNVGGIATGANVSRDFMNLEASSQPTIANYNDPTTQAEILQFYTQWQFPTMPANETVQQFFDQLIIRVERLFNGTFFYYYNATYYRMNLVQTSTPMTYYYAAAPYGQGPRNPAVPQQAHCPLFAPVPPPPSPFDNAINEIKGLSGGSIFLITLLCTIVVYFVAGTLLNTYKFKKTGLDRIPNRMFWVGFGRLIKDGTVWTFRKIFKRGEQNNYAYVQ
eukprot:TRINITY_DN3817_c0_g2_i3.p1 TRINITY_DN3817_c0_g2~~TRINITY_DN3817_c0_g2_i3.p1  ORF type:complete len:220 (+),score=72.28 TRINITY_DN3817_c0_g2_i3:411-1070(+)